MVTVKTRKEIEILREGGRRLAGVVESLKKKVAPGIQAADLETYARGLVKDLSDLPAFLNYKPRGASRPYPAALCVSINDEVVHGVPDGREKVLKEGDIVSLDMGLVHKGLFTDMAVTMPVGNISKKAKKLLQVTEEALYVGIEAVRSGAKTGDIGYTIQKFVEPYGYGIIRELAGHGVGYGVHEEPYVPNYGNSGEGAELRVGMVIAIEPMLTLGDRQIMLDADGFTYRTRDGSLSAHFEHTVVVTKEGGEIITKK